jgi:hypothetical protein
VHELSCDQSKTTQELLDITTRHASTKEVVGAVFIQGDEKAFTVDSRGASPKTTDKSSKRRAKGSGRGPKPCPQRVVIATSCDEDDDNKEADDSDEEHVTAVECNFKCHAWQLADHFKKLLEATCPNHAYPIRHKHKECSMMKNYMTTVALAKSKKPKGDPVGKTATPFLGEEKVMSIYEGPVPHDSWRKLKLTSRVVNVVSLVTLEYLYWSEPLSILIGWITWTVSQSSGDFPS